MTSAAAHVINHNGCKIGRFKLLHLSDLFHSEGLDRLDNQQKTNNHQKHILSTYFISVNTYTTFLQFKITSNSQ